MKNWLNQHIQAIHIVLHKMRINLMSTLLICLVMGVTLCLPGLLYIVVSNLNHVAGAVKAEPQISVFLKLDASSTEIAAIDEKLAQHTGVLSRRFVSRTEAWQELKAKSPITEGLNENPLPDAYFVQPKDVSPAAVDALKAEFQSYPGVELAQIDATWLKRLHALLGIGEKAILILSAILGFAIIAIIGNTIRLQIFTQREEIEVSKLIGATDRFIRRPFLYAGTIYGVGGGIAALILINIIVSLFNYSITDFAKLYASDFKLSLLPLNIQLSLILFSLSLGLFGSWLAVNQTMKKFNA